MQTSLANVYAIGDITSQIQLTNVAYVHSAIVVRAILNKPFTPLDLSNVPYALYITPEVASIGATEQVLEKSGQTNYLAVNLPAAALPRNHAEQTFQQGFFKIIIDKTSHQILGAHIALDNASLIINELALAMTKKLTIFDLLATSHTHPTLSEAIFYVARKVTISLK